MVGAAFLFTLLFLGCTSNADTPDDTATVPSTTEEEPEKTGPSEEESQEEPAEEMPEEKTVSAESGSEDYTMGEEEYQETKKDLSKLVAELNRIIANRNYKEWLTYLTKEYKEYYSDPEVLKEYSDSPLLKKYDIKLRSLKDYFDYVVVASRKDVHIDDIKALNENKVRAYMIVNEKPIVVYTLERVGDKWKITK